MAGDPGWDFGWFEKYKDYIRDIKKIIEKDRLIERRKEFQKIIDTNYEFNEVPYTAFYPEFLFFPYRYKKSVINDFGYPTDEEGVKDFKDTVEIIPSLNIKKQEAKKGDLIFEFMFIDPIKQELCTRVGVADKDISNLKAGTVFRHKNISSYYLKVFLESEFVKDYCLGHYYAPRDSECLENSEYVDIDISKLPVILTGNSKSDFFRKKIEMQKAKSSIERRLEK